jgi:hypothetical protein
MEGTMKILLEMMEMVFAFFGVIWTMQLAAFLIRKKPEDICNEKYYIGKVSLTSNQNNKVVTVINLYMKELDNGMSIRDYTVIAEEDWEKIFWSSQWGIELKAWINGGSFPRKFEPIDPLGEMLNRMMKKKMGVSDA